MYWPIESATPIAASDRVQTVTLSFAGYFYIIPTPAGSGLFLNLPTLPVERSDGHVAEAHTYGGALVTVWGSGQADDKWGRP